LEKIQPSNSVDLGMTVICLFEFQHSTAGNRRVVILLNTDSVPGVELIDRHSVSKLFVKLNYMFL
jgi:hypothetical protein